MGSELKHPQVEMYESEISDIPVLEFKPSAEEGRRIVRGSVIFYHGWSSRKENQIFRASTIASHGYRVVVPDAFHHGDRGELDYDSEEALSRHFFPILIQSVRESAALIDYLQLEKDSPSGCSGDDSLAVMGHSMGGFIASGVITARSGVDTMINVNGSCAWLKIREILLQEMQERSEEELEFDPRDTEVELAGGESVDLEDYDPYHNIAALDSRPVLLLHGEEDSSVPLAGQRYFYQRARSHYGESPDNLRLEIYENLNHYFTTGMLAESIEWLNSWL